MKKLAAASLCALMVTGLFGCAYPMPTTPAAPSETTEEIVEETAEEAAEEAEAEEEDEENYETGDASLDDPLNQDEIGEKELLVVSFGTSFNDSRRLTIGAIEKDLQEAFPDYSVRRAFTSQIIIDHVKERDGEVIDNVTEALDRAVANGVKTLVVQPTHLMHGFEYNDLVNEIANYADAFEKIVISEPLLNTDEDFQKVAEAVTARTKEYDDGETAICFMGHGTEADSNGVYAKMQELITSLGYENYYVGTVEATPSLEDVLALVQAGEYKKVVLEPLMVVAGDHANNDMAGDEEDSWKSVFEAAGYEVECILEGLGQNADVRAIYVEHCKEAVEEAELVADASEMTEVKDVVEDGMKPILASSIEDGVYDITVDSSSSMFRITACELTVDGDTMSAKMTMGGTGYLYVYPGTGAEAVKASEADYIPFAEEDGKHTFTVSVEALDAPFELAAFSKNKEKWYDRTLVFRADSLPAEALGTEGSAETAAELIKRLGLTDGKYTAEAKITGGSGKAYIESPAELTVKGDMITAVIVFSSPNYDYVIASDEKYTPVNTEGNSAFELPVPASRFIINADTTAMSKPHEIEYELSFDPDTIEAVK